MVYFLLITSFSNQIEWTVLGDSESKSDKVKSSLIKIFQKIENIVKIQEKTQENFAILSKDLDNKKGYLMDIDDLSSLKKNKSSISKIWLLKYEDSKENKDDGCIYSSTGLNTIIVELNNLLNGFNNNENEVKVKSLCNKTNSSTTELHESNESYLKTELFYDLGDNIPFSKNEKLQEFAKAFGSSSGNKFEAIEDLDFNYFLSDNNLVKEKEKDLSYSREFNKVFPKFLSANKTNENENENELKSIEKYLSKLEKVTVLQKQMILW